MNPLQNNLIENLNIYAPGNIDWTLKDYLHSLDEIQELSDVQWLT